MEVRLHLQKMALRAGTMRWLPMWSPPFDDFDPFAEAGDLGHCQHEMLREIGARVLFQLVGAGDVGAAGKRATN